MRWQIIKDTRGVWKTTSDANDFFRVLAMLHNRGVTVESDEARLTKAGWAIRKDVLIRKGKE